MSNTLIAQFDALDVVIPYDRGDLVAQFHQFGTIEQEEFEERGTHLRGHMPTNHSDPFKRFQVAPLRGSTM
jgi:GTP-binding protein HflX